MLEQPSVGETLHVANKKYKIKFTLNQSLEVQELKKHN